MVKILFTLSQLTLINFVLSTGFSDGLLGGVSSCQVVSPVSDGDCSCCYFFSEADL